MLQVSRRVSLFARNRLQSSGMSSGYQISYFQVVWGEGMEKRWCLKYYWNFSLSLKLFQNKRKNFDKTLCLQRCKKWECRRLVILCVGQFGPTRVYQMSIIITMHISFDPAVSLQRFYFTNIFVKWCLYKVIHYSLVCGCKIFETF